VKPELTHFLEKVRKNPSLKARLQERPEELVAVAKELGFQLKIEDF
jgi:predicted ribosomally synthesized peptide with nif11-like leader